MAWVVTARLGVNSSRANAGEAFPSAVACFRSNPALISTKWPGVIAAEQGSSCGNCGLPASKIQCGVTAVAPEKSGIILFLLYQKGFVSLPNPLRFLPLDHAFHGIRWRRGRFFHDGRRPGGWKALAAIFHACAHRHELFQPIDTHALQFILVKGTRLMRHENRQGGLAPFLMVAVHRRE